MVTLNCSADIAPARVLHTATMHHPVYTPGAVAAQKRRYEVSGRNRTFYCGAYWRYGFHEDGVLSAEWAVKDVHVIIARDTIARSKRPAWADVG
jgi:predicted NAD/FAD-binding protein